MGFKLEVYCDTCGGEKKPSLEFVIETTKELRRDALQKRIEAEGWVVQPLPDDLLTYCTRKCAE